MRTVRRPPPMLDDGRREAVRRKKVQGLAIPAIDIPKFAVAETNGILNIVENTGSSSPGELR